MAVVNLHDGNDDGAYVGSSSTQLVGFWGATPTSQLASSTLSSTLSLFTMTGASHVANASTTVSGLFGFNSTEISQLIDALRAIRSWMAETGLHKGGA